LRYGPPARLTAAKQYFLLRSSPHCRGKGSLRKGRLVWEYSARPTPLSREYAVRIVYQQGNTPEVFVVDPDLTEISGGRTLPHVYSQKPVRLCLYLPNTGEWSPAMAISDTLVPWTALWLFYFEDWLSTNTWNGGGKHPDISDDKEANTRNRRRRH